MSETEIPPLKSILKSGLYLIPIIIIIYIVFSGYTPSRAAIYGMFATILVSWVYGEHRIFIKDLFETAEEILYSVAPLVVACASAGILISSINLTGLVGKFTTLIFSVSGESVLMVLIISALISILLGLGMPTPAVYVLTATLTGPAIIDTGIPLLAAHLFLVFFASMSAITPPVGVAAYTAAGIAEASPIKIGIAAVKLAITAFLLPFMFVFQPALLMHGTLIEIMLAFLFACLGLWAVAIGAEGYWKRSLNWWTRSLFIGSGILVTYPEIWSTVLGGLVLTAVLLIEKKTARNLTTKGE